MNSNTLPFPKHSMSIPRNLWFFLSIRFFYQNVLLLPQLFFYLNFNQRVIPCCSKHTELLCTVYCLWCCLLWTYNMYWPRTPVISESSHIGNTILALTPCNHITISIALGIVPSRHFIFTNVSYVLGSPRTLCPNIHLQYWIWLFSLVACQHWGMLQGHQKFPRLLLCLH